MKELLNSWYDDLRKEIKTNETSYAEYMKKHFVHSGKSKISLNKLMKLTGAKITINKNIETNTLKIRKNAYESCLAYIQWSKKLKPKYDKIGISMTFVDNRTKHNKRDLILLLLHELSHGLLHRTKTTDNFHRDEIEAQIVAHIVGRYLGLKENVSSSMIKYAKQLREEYYEKNPDIKKESPIRKSKIIKTSQKIIECLEENKIIYKEFFKI